MQIFLSSFLISFPCACICTSDGFPAVKSATVTVIYLLVVKHVVQCCKLTCHAARVDAREEEPSTVYILKDMEGWNVCQVTT